MDRTETYIKMCDWPEIQDRWRPKIGDWFANRDPWEETEPEIKVVCWVKKMTMYVYEPSLNRRDEWSTSNGIWLPCQGQLQEMVRPLVEHNQRNTYAAVKGENPEAFIELCLVADFARWCEHQCWQASMEQLWLAFVMWELHKKVWNGKEWKIK